MKKIIEILENHGIDNTTSEAFGKYYQLLIEWNEKINLTAITEETEVAYKHFIDCMSVFNSEVIADGAKVIDIGTGAGFPGIPMKLYNKSLKITLLDSLNKRINFLSEVISQLQLSDMTTLHGRAEDYGVNKAHREQYDICVSRAVANLATLSELCLPFVKVGGYFIAMKGPKAQEELDAAKNAIKLLGGKVEKVVNYDISDTDYDHNMILIKKISATSTKYPRKAPKPAKEPLI